MEEIKKLSVLTALTTLLFTENHVAEDPQYRMEVLVAVAGIDQLDGEPFEEEERAEAFTLREKRAAELLEQANAEAAAKTTEAADEAAEPTGDDA